MFIWVLALSAFFIAACAAFFSIKGLIVLFSGSAIAIAVMASALELGKLVAASFLHRYWLDVSKALKVYLCVAIFILMGITSLGIFGFLSNAYAAHSAIVSKIDASLELLNTKRSGVQTSIDDVQKRIELLNHTRAGQEQRLAETLKLKTAREQTYKAIEEANKELAAKTTELETKRTELSKIDEDITKERITASSNTDIGSFKFIANIFDTNVDTVVKYFIFALVFVFDPLAIALVLSLNLAIEKHDHRSSKRNTGRDRRGRLQTGDDGRDDDPSERTEVGVHQPVQGPVEEVITEIEDILIQLKEPVPKELLAEAQLVINNEDIEPEEKKLMLSRLVERYHQSRKAGKGDSIIRK